MPDEPERSLEDRVRFLETAVERLESALARLSAAPASPAARTPTRAARASTSPRPAGGLSESLKDVRYWFRILGIGLLLLGTVFIFKYSEDESRRIMALRVAVGATMGLGLVGVGRRMRRSEPHFGSVLLGGGIAVWYITGFAAFQIFDLVPALPAFGFMTVVTVLAFMLAIRQRVVALSVIGAIGGLGTPWLLHETNRPLAGPIAYMCLVLAGAIAVYVRQSWKALLWSSALVAGGAFAAIAGRYYVQHGLSQERMTLQFGVAVYWALYAVAPVWTELRRRTPTPNAKQEDVSLFITLIAVYGIVMTIATWEPDLRIGGWVGILGSLPYAAAWYRLERSPSRRPIAVAHLLSALILLTAGFASLLHGETLLLTVTAEGAAVHALSRRVRGVVLPAWGHLLFLFTGLFALGRIAVQETGGMPVLNHAALANLFVIAAAAASSLAMRSKVERLAYRYTAHGFILLWVLRELHGLPDGQGIVSTVWGVYAIALVIAGLRFNSAKLRVVGLVTLLLTVLKLVVVDLSAIKAIWRVLIFSVFGVVLLALSHWAARFTDIPPAERREEAGRGL